MRAVGDNIQTPTFPLDIIMMTSSTACAVNILPQKELEVAVV